MAWEPATWSLDLSISAWVLLGLAALLIILLLWRWFGSGIALRSFEIDQAEIGVGHAKLRFRPTTADRQVAYAIWVELSTRKIGLPIDFEHDLISEIYDSWYTFFSVTRELVKSVPVANVRGGSTQAIVRLSIEVLNEGLRPHLTRWQARFRRWYERELKRYDDATDEAVVDPQQVQGHFPQYTELKADMERVNEVLIRYRAKMNELFLRN